MSGRPNQFASETGVGTTGWPLQDIASTNCVWCTAYKGGGWAGVVRCAIVVQTACDSVGNADGEGRESADSLVHKSVDVNEYRKKTKLQNVSCVLTGPCPVLAFTRYCFNSSRLCTSQSSFHSYSAPALPTMLQYSCMAIGQYTTPPSTSLWYAIHHTILAITISCKGQVPCRSLRSKHYSFPRAVRASRCGPAWWVNPIDCAKVV